MNAVMGEGDMGDLADLLAHSKRMQQTVYNESVRSVKKARISTILKKVLSGEPVTAHDMEKAEYGV